MIRSLKELQIIINHFDRYPLLSQKLVDYNLFKDAILLIKNKEHLNKEGFRKVLYLKASINLGLSDELKLSFPDIKPISIFLSHRNVVLKNNLVGISSATSD